METKHTVTVRNHLYAGDQLNLAESAEVAQEEALNHTDCLCRPGHPKYGFQLPCRLPFEFRRVVSSKDAGRSPNAAAELLVFIQHSK
jgi:hypothetical protein